MDEKIISFFKDKFGGDDIIPLHAPSFIGNEKKYLADCIDSTYVSSIGPYVNQFEKLMSKITNSNEAIAVVNGTAGLHIALKLVGVKKNEEVITQALTFVATANAIKYNGAFPIFLDVDLDTMGLSPNSVEAFLEKYGELRDDGCYNRSTGRKISACLPMHTFGFPVHLDELLKVCSKWKISVVEDAAESLGSTYKGKSVGSFGDLAVFSFNGNKIVTSGGGGVVVTNDTYLAERAKFLTTTAKQPHRYEYYHTEIGYNYRMPNINAALACAQLENFEKLMMIKRSLAKDYENFFFTKGIKFITEPKNTKANYWLMCVELNDLNDRNLFLDYTNSKNVMTRPIWKGMDLLPMYRDCQTDELSNTRYLESRIVNIPSSAII